MASLRMKTRSGLCNWSLLVISLAAVVLVGCANHYTPATFTDHYGFFSGVWHGIIFLFSLIGVFISWILSLAGINFLDSVQIIGRPNTGLWYYVGFGFGLLCLTGANS
jgi:hypothetical protein